MLFSFCKDINIRDLFFGIQKTNSSLIIMTTTLWTFDMAQELISLRARYRDDFENASNREHINIWHNIAVRISLNHNCLVTARQCQIKWAALKSGYDNICRILSGNREGFHVYSPNFFDIEFFDLMQREFWLPRSNNSINLT